MSKLQRGFAPILIVIVVALALAGGGYYLYSTGKVALPGLSGIKMLNIASEKDFESISDPLLRKNFVAQTNVAAFRTTSLSSGKGLTDIAEYENTGTDFKTRWVQKDGDKEIGQLILIGDTTYVKDYSDNTWWMQTTKPTESMEQEIGDPEDIKDEFLKEDQTLYKNLGEEACGELTCHKYEQTFKDSPGTRTFWFDTKYFLMRKEISGYGEFSVEIVYSYDNISISAPSPTKEVPEGRSAFEYYTQQPAAPGARTNTNTDVQYQPQAADYQEMQDAIEQFQEDYPQEDYSY